MCYSRVVPSETRPARPATMFEYTDADNTGLPAVPVVDTERAETDPAEDLEETVLSHRLSGSDQ